MNWRLKKALKGWLAAEAEGRTQEAERRLTAAFRARSAESPAPDFVARTMARLSPAWSAVRQTEAPVSPFLEWAFKVGAAAALLLAAISVFLLGGMASAFVRSGGGEHAVGWGIGLLTAASQQVARSLAFWDGVNRVAGAVASALVNPSSLTALVAGLLVSLTAFGLLTRLVASEGSVNHV